MKLKDILQDEVEEKYYIEDSKVENLIWDLRSRVGEDGIWRHDVVFPVSVRKYPVDIVGLQKLLGENKGDFTNKEIADSLGVKITTVEHWFRTDSSFSIPDKDIWLELRGLLGIEDDSFDKSIITFITKDSSYDQSNRIYDTRGISPTLTTGGGEQIIEPTIVASRGRNPGNPSDRTVGSPTEQRLEPNRQGTANTITTVQKDNWVLEPKVAVREATKKGYDYRIRKLTPLECWRLMGFEDEDYWVARRKLEEVFYNGGDRSNSQMYKQAGNSIVVDVLEGIFENLLAEEE